MECSSLPINKQMLSSRDLPLHASQHMSDPHQMIIHHIGKVVRWVAVTLHEHWIALVERHVVCYTAEDQVFEELAV